MGLVVYTATQSIVPGHISGEQVSMVVCVRDYIRGRDVVKHVHRSSAGAMETLNERADTTWSIEFGPIDDALLPNAKEFADSTAGGEVFTVDLISDIGAGTVLTLRRVDSQHQFARIKRTGNVLLDKYAVRIGAIEAT